MQYLGLLAPLPGTVGYSCITKRTSHIAAREVSGRPEKEATRASSRTTKLCLFFFRPAVQVTNEMRLA